MTARELGRVGEKAAAIWLEEHGYTITGRNVRVGHGEIDLIAEDAAFLCFVEVKTRRQFPDYRPWSGKPVEAVTRRKQAILLRSADAWLYANPTEKQPRIDVMEVYADPESDVFRILLIEHYPNAVRKRAWYPKPWY